MRCRALLLWSIFAAAIGSSVPGFAQDSQTQESPKKAPDSRSTASDPQQLPGEQVQPGDSEQEVSPQDEPRQAQAPQIKHDGGKKDVDAIGHRKVGGLDWYPMESDIKIGKTLSQQLESRVVLIKDPAVNEYVNRIGQNLVRNSDAKIPFTIKVVDDDEINAMALPGGFLYVNSGLIFAADDEAEMAGVMAHEIAHVALRHGTRGLTRLQLARILTTPLIFVGGPAGLAALEAARLGMPMTFLAFSRDFEAEADYFGLQYMYKAGYDPHALVTIFEKIQALDKRKPGAVSQVFATHPLTADRIKKSQKEIASILPARENYVETTSEFSEAKARLAVARNRMRMADASQNKPTLRHRVNDSSDAGPGDQKKDDDRPVLNRRD